MTATQALELWGGIECTVNRVGDRFFDQLRATGHHHRHDDLDAIFELGVRALRYPLVWERTAPHTPGAYNWRWADARLGQLHARMSEAELTPILGLLHHGSGPAYTQLLDPEFPAAFARYAGEVARRYPWIDHYTPINEPLTTARFAGLYGHWYPHRRDDASFCRMLVHQCQAIQMAMAAIRRVNPAAKLIQTEDLGLTLASSRALIDQAAFENHRRFLGFDLLCGRVDRTAPLYPYLRRSGIREDELARLGDARPPDLLGANHYITSTRLLDTRLRHYRADQLGGNGRQAYVDVEAIRVDAHGLVDPARLLGQLWDRYRLPIAITEVQLAGHVDEQIRWFKELWDAAQRGRAAGQDIRAVTSWSLLGACDWHCLVTQETGCYEPGAFDVSSGRPRLTELGRYLAEVARGIPNAHPALSERGWWRRSERLLYPAVDAVDTTAPHRHRSALEVG
jgi:dTDP-4-dehydrorhamnose reductase